MQLANEETTLRLHSANLRQPLSVLASMIGTRGADSKRTVIDPFSDALLIRYNAKYDAEHLNTHNTCCQLFSTCALQAHAPGLCYAGLPIRFLCATSCLQTYERGA